MNPYPDQSDPELDEPGLSALYRQGATQTPPAALDRRILDQAQAALQPQPEKGVTPGVNPFVRGKASRRWLLPWPRFWDWTPRWKWPWGWSGIRDWPRRWGRPQYWHWPPRLPPMGDGRWTWRRLAIPLSSAAGILLTVGLVLRILDEQSAMQGVTGMAPTPLADYQPSHPSQSTQPIQSSPSSKSEREFAAKEAPEEVIGLSSAARLSRVPSPAPAIEPTVDGAIGQTKVQAKNQAETQAPLDDRRPAMPMADTAGAPHQKSQIIDVVPQVVGEPPHLTDERYQADPERWLEDIRQNWSSGQREEAIRQLAAFRQVHPQYPLPEDLAFIH